ncbi:MAG TPA: CHAT domain-containing protein [Pyrinomonadaceae bacterium]|nr:CHAT domain-containing protein [Pyrinomonadaceae bacterium]
MDIVADELIDEYVQGTIPDSELEQFEQYFLRSPARQEDLSLARALKKRKSKLRSIRRLSRFYLPVAAVLVVSFTTVIWRIARTESEAHKGFIALQSAYREHRPVEPRLSDFSYAPAPALRGEPQKVDYVQLDRAAEILLGAVAEDPDAESHRTLGQYYLASHELDKAINQFNLSLGLDANSAKAHNDLGAALLEKGKLLIARAEPDATKTFAASLQHFNKALELDPSFIAALFNRAVLYQQMKLPAEAEQSWREYLSKDSTSGWADEARQNLAVLEEQKKNTSQSKTEILRDFQAAYEAGDEGTAWQIFSSYHNRTGNVVFEELLDSYLVSRRRGSKNETEREFRRLSYAGELANRKAGEKFFNELVSFYAAASPERLDILEQARKLLKSAHDGWGRDPFTVSLERFGEARRLFEQAANVAESTVAGYWISFCLYHQHRTDEALAMLQPLIAVSEAKDYKWLKVRALYLSSILQYDLTNYSRAIVLADESLALAEQTGDAVGKLNAFSSLIEYNRSFSNYDKSQEYIQRSLDLLNRTTLDPVQGCRHYGLIATSLNAAGWPDAAAAYQKEALRYAFNSERPATIPYTLSFLVQIQAKLKKFDEAEEAARRALQMAEEQSDKDRMAYALVQLGHVYRQKGNFEKALESYDKAIALYKELKYTLQLYLAHKGRLFCYLAQGRNQLAEQEMAEASRLIESSRNNIFEPDNRSSLFDAEQTLYDAAIGFQYSKMGSPERAFDHSESSRARSLLDLINADKRVLTGNQVPELILEDASQSLSFAAIKERLPDKVQVLQFAMLEEQLIIWVLAGKRMSSTAVPVKGEELNRRVSDYIRLVSSAPGSSRDSELVASHARELYDTLIKPVESLLVSDKQLCIVPDKILNLLPFGTLRSRDSGEYLFTKYELMVSPSSTALVLFSERAERHGLSRAEKILSVGNASFDRDAFPSLPDLPSAMREATQVAEYYDSRTVLAEKEASVARVVSELKNSDVIHFALHSVLDERVPMRSKFLLARPPGSQKSVSESVLFAHDIYELKLPRVKLAVLSACETGGGGYVGGEGVMNMARPFLSAGVPLVVATLWPVESNATAQFMINFHRRRAREGLPVARALQQAQLDMLRHSDSRMHDPYYWAPFVLIGGYANY